MKKLSKFFVFWVFALCMFTFASCDSDNDANAEEVEALREQYVIDGLCIGLG